MGQIRIPGNLFSIVRRSRRRTRSFGNLSDTSNSFEVIRARYSYQLGRDSVLDETGRIGDMLMSTDELDDHLLRMERNFPDPPPNSPCGDEFQWNVGGSSRLSLISNLLLTNPSIPYSSYRESSSEISNASGNGTDPVNTAIIHTGPLGFTEQEVFLPTLPIPEARPVPSFIAIKSELNPQAEPFTPGLNLEEVEPLSPSIQRSLLKAFSAPTSPEDGGPGLCPITVGATRRSVIMSTGKVTSRRPPNTTMEWSEAGDIPLPDSNPSTVKPVQSERKRVRTLTTSACGPDIEEALKNLISERVLKRPRKEDN